MSAQLILKRGNSLAFRIPSAIAKQMDINEGAEVRIPAKTDSRSGHDGQPRSEAT